jgi:hypothetical protein
MFLPLFSVERKRDKIVNLFTTGSLTSTSLSKEGIVSGDDCAKPYTLYTIQVDIREKMSQTVIKTWTVDRRYTAFHKLHVFMLKQSFKGPALPPKKIWNSSESKFIERRRIALELWLRATLSIISAQSSLPNEKGIMRLFKKFLNIGIIEFPALTLVESYNKEIELAGQTQADIYLEKQLRVALNSADERLASEDMKDGFDTRRNSLDEGGFASIFDKMTNGGGATRESGFPSALTIPETSCVTPVSVPVTPTSLTMHTTMFTMYTNNVLRSVVDILVEEEKLLRGSNTSGLEGTSVRDHEWGTKTSEWESWTPSDDEDNDSLFSTSLSSVVSGSWGDNLKKRVASNVDFNNLMSFPQPRKSFSENNLSLLGDAGGLPASSASSLKGSGSRFFGQRRDEFMVESDVSMMSKSLQTRPLKSYFQSHKNLSCSDLYSHNGDYGRLPLSTFDSDLLDSVSVSAGGRGDGLSSDLEEHLSTLADLGFYDGSTVTLDDMASSSVSSKAAFSIIPPLHSTMGGGSFEGGGPVDTAGTAHPSVAPMSHGAALAVESLVSSVRDTLNLKVDSLWRVTAVMDDTVYFRKTPVKTDGGVQRYIARGQIANTAEVILSLLLDLAFWRKLWPEIQEIKVLKEIDKYETLYYVSCEHVISKKKIGIDYCMLVTSCVDTSGALVLCMRSVSSVLAPVSLSHSRGWREPTGFVIFPTSDVACCEVAYVSQEALPGLDNDGEALESIQSSSQRNIGVVRKEVMKVGK